MGSARRWFWEIPTLLAHDRPSWAHMRQYRYRMSVSGRIHQRVHKWSLRIKSTFGQSFPWIKFSVWLRLRVRIEMDSVKWPVNIILQWVWGRRLLIVKWNTNMEWDLISASLVAVLSDSLIESFIITIGRVQYHWIIYKREYWLSMTRCSSVLLWARSQVQCVLLLEISLCVYFRLNRVLSWLRGSLARCESLL